MKNKSLDFVAKYYKQGTLDVKSAYKKTLHRASVVAVPCAGHQPSVLKATHLVDGRHKARPLHWAIAASIAVLFAAGTYFFFRPSVTTLASADTNKVFTLADGTVVTLAPHSTLSYKGDCREVELTGKAYMNIHHDPAHPFIIKDDNYTIRDIGTRLLIDETDSQQTFSHQPSPREEGVRITVYVEEGSVALCTPNDSTSKIVLKKNQGATVSSNGKAKRIANASENMTAWATHEFHFDNTPLPEVLRDLSDYYHVSLSCKTSEGKHLTADFQADSLQNIIAMIEVTLNVDIEK